MRIALFLVTGVCLLLLGLWGRAARGGRRARLRAEREARELKNGFEQELMERTSRLVEANNKELEAFARSVANLEEQLNERTAQLEATNRELEAFAYSVSHDLRAPLERIEGFSAALLEDYGAKLDTQGQDYLERVQAATRRMGELIDALLKLSRLTRGELRRGPVDLTGLAGEATQELRRAHPERDVTVVIAPGLAAEGDPELLRVAVENLLGNAWKFTSRRENARIEFGALDPAEAERAGHAGKTVYFVRDNGAGFDMAYAGKLFAAFQRLHASTDFPGTGIGLATVSRIVHRHGGQVWGEGVVDGGACFYFTL